MGWRRQRRPFGVRLLCCRKTAGTCSVGGACSLSSLESPLGRLSVMLAKATIRAYKKRFASLGSQTVTQWTLECDGIRSHHTSVQGECFASFGSQESSIGRLNMVQTKASIRSYSGDDSPHSWAARQIYAMQLLHLRDAERDLTRSLYTETCEHATSSARNDCKTQWNCMVYTNVYQKYTFRLSMDNHKKL
jgi:hypothetical protein